MPHCKAKKADGSPCRAKAQSGRDFCFFHDPKKVDEARAAQAKGGSRQPKSLTELTPWRPEVIVDGDTLIYRKPATTDVVNLLADTIDDVRVGRLDPRVANSVGYLANIIIRALETEALEERLAALEEAVMGRI